MTKIHIIFFTFIHCTALLVLVILRLNPFLDFQLNSIFHLRRALYFITLPTATNEKIHANKVPSQYMYVAISESNI